MPHHYLTARGIACDDTFGRQGGRKKNGRTEEEGEVGILISFVRVGIMSL
jgi:hypothetical protein